MIIQLYHKTTAPNGDTETDKDGNCWEPVEGELLKLSTGRSGLRYGDTLAVPKPVLTDRLGQRRRIIIVELILPDLGMTLTINKNTTLRSTVVREVALIQEAPDHNYVITATDGKVFAIHSTTATYVWQFDDGTKP